MWRTSATFLKNLKHIPLPDFQRSETANAFQTLLSRMSVSFLSFQDFRSMNFGAKISLGVEEFEALRIYENSPSELKGILQTMLDLKREYSTYTKQSLIFIADIAFYKEWWQAYIALEPVNRCIFQINYNLITLSDSYSNVTILWGTFHPWLKALGYIWNAWGDISQWFFKIFFAKGKFHKDIKSIHARQFYDSLFASLPQLVQSLEQSENKIQDSRVYKRLHQYLTIVVPTIHYYFHALHCDNYESFFKLQTQLFLLILHCRAREYSVAFVHNQILWHYWKTSCLQQLLKRHWLLNEEIGEITLSILARSAQNTPEHVKTQQLVENYSLITHVHHMSLHWNDAPISASTRKQQDIQLNLVEAFEQQLKQQPPVWGTEVKDAKGKTLNIIWDFLDDTDFQGQLYLHFESVNRLWLTPSKSSLTRIQASQVEKKYTDLFQAFL